MRTNRAYHMDTEDWLRRIPCCPRCAAPELEGTDGIVEQPSWVAGLIHSEDFSPPAANGTYAAASRPVSTWWLVPPMRLTKSPVLAKQGLPSMPVFHTKTIESILEPVAQQVSRLVILHEEAEDGNAMPDLTRPVDAVSRAVENLVHVGYDTCHSSDDDILKQDMPPALQRVESSSRLLEEACYMLKDDPYSSQGRKKLIEGARGILQGTSALLLCFDESEVRKIVRVCQKVLDYLAVSEVIENMEDLVQFVRDISPWLTKMSRETEAREKELTHQVHREILVRCIDSVKTLAPILICAMKIFIQISAQGGKGIPEAAENRNYLSTRVVEEVNEVIRVLQLTTYDEDEWDEDDVIVMKKALSAIESLLQAAFDWLADSRALRGGVGEKSLRRILEYTDRIADRALPMDASVIRRARSDIASMTDSLCELRHNKQGDSPQAQGLARGIAQKLRELVGTKDMGGLLPQAVHALERAGVAHPAHTVLGRIEQVLKWLANPYLDDKGVGRNALVSLLAEARKMADLCPAREKYAINLLCDEIDRLCQQLTDLQRKGMGDSPQARAIVEQLRDKLHDLKEMMDRVLLDRVVDDFADITTPLKQFAEAVVAPEGTPGREQNFADKAQNLRDHCQRCAHTGRLVGTAGPCKDKKIVEALCSTANQVANMTPQVINAGKIRFHYPQNVSADEHFENLRRELADALLRLRNLVDDAVDPADFVKASEEAMRRHGQECEKAISNNEPQKMVDHTSNIARLGNRVLMATRGQAENSEDPIFSGRLNDAADRLQAAIPPMVTDAKQVALNPRDQGAVNRWRDSNGKLLDAVGNVRRALEPTHLPDMRNLDLNEVRMPPPPQPGPYQQQVASHREGVASPFRPPPPMELRTPPRPPPPQETDDEEEMRAFWERVPLPKANQPILSAAHSLHREVQQWSSRENEIVAAAKRMAILMARLSQLVRGEGGTKKDLIDCAKAIADASEEVTRLAVLLAKQCTDIKMRKALLQVCERIPTIATQLKILSTVKATMLGSQAAAVPAPDGGEIPHGTDEDEEAMQQLVLNAQNLMQSVKDTVRAAEAASIKIRTDSGLRLRWVRKPMWSNY
uniref:Vinculin n=1 Tax=Trichuris muris TaxID=70415 RepID=A0A5S6QXE8_TRIMR